MFGGTKKSVSHYCHTLNLARSNCETNYGYHATYLRYTLGRGPTTRFFDDLLQLLITSYNMKFRYAFVGDSFPWPSRHSAHVDFEGRYFRLYCLCGVGNIQNADICWASKSIRNETSRESHYTHHTLVVRSRVSNTSFMTYAYCTDLGGV